MKKELYPNAEQLKRRPTARPAENEPIILETAAGYCPNYELFERAGIDAETALVFCNMD